MIWFSSPPVTASATVVRTAPASHPTQNQPVTAPRGAAFVRDDTSGGAAYKVYRARAGSYRFNA